MDNKSYEGGLLPTPSMPIGQIPHALVVPYAELTLDDLIGAGAEGKVSRAPHVCVLGGGGGHWQESRSCCWCRIMQVGGFGGPWGGVGTDMLS